MKLQLLKSAAFLFIFLTSCQNKTIESDPQSKLAELKQQAKDINDQIKALQIQIAESDTTNLSKKSKIVVVDTLKPIDFAYYIDVQGLVESDLNVLASPQTPGVVTAIYVNEGEKVQAGKILATLDAGPIRKAQEEIKTGLDLAITLYDKQKRLWDQQIGSEAQYLQAKNQKEQLEQKLKTLDAQIAMSYIKAPVSGTVDAVLLKIGEMAAPGMSGIRVVNNNEMSIKAQLSDKYVNEVKKGDKVSIEIPGKNLEFNSRIEYVSNSISARSRTFIIDVALPKSKYTFNSNQSVRLKINSSNIPKALVISTNLIQTSINGEEYVLIAVQENGFWHAKRKNITTGISYQGQTEIKQGLTAGDQIISSGYSELVDGQMIAL
ncbi:MAG: efflux RND transporter periplasmic adaptor subunit [Saprospiraceae bacterium]|nr:efflux RND transporter periplasmic adaptor subunit [Saprospiraceae bacterium]